MYTPSEKDARCAQTRAVARTRSFKRGAIALAVSTAIALASGFSYAQLTEHSTAKQAATAAPVTVQTPVSFADIVEKVKPAVVNVAVSGEVSLGEQENPSFNGTPYEEFFKRFFGQPPAAGGPDHPKIQGQGSGFIIDPEGYVVTNNHVVKGADEVSVVLNDGRRFSAKIQGSDAKTDLALLKIDAKEPLPYVNFAATDNARAGDWVLAIGNPFGLGGTVTTGIISARERDINSNPYDDYLQIDAPINRGNSGGPLFDLQGNVIGVNTAIFSPNGGNVGIGFAIPALQAKAIVAQLKDSGHVERGWLGVQIQQITDDLAQSLNLPDTKGALIAGVTPDSPAARAGIKAGDVIVSFDDKDIVEMKDLPRYVAATTPDHKSKVGIWRNGSRSELAVEVKTLPVTLAEQTEEANQQQHNSGKLGLALAPISKELHQQFGIEEDVNGSVVVGVRPQSIAALNGLRPGDVIMRAGTKSIQEPKDVADAVKLASQDTNHNKLVLLVNRQGNQWFLTLNLA